MGALTQRDIDEKYATVTLFARIVANGLGVSETAVDRLLEGYKDVLTGYAYTPEYAVKSRLKRKQAVHKKLKKKESDESLLQKVQKLSAPADPDKKR